MTKRFSELEFHTYVLLVTPRGDVFLREQGMIIPMVVEIPLGKILRIKRPGTSVKGSSYVICDCYVRHRVARARFTCDGSECDSSVNGSCDLGVWKDNMLAKSEKIQRLFVFLESPAHITVQYFVAQYWPNHLGTRPNVSRIA
ncbi:hypothetical protein OSB04_015632 [Centaurea solstitialis]|uniref:Uncharacterized protein n=1 Tax=Centaurea solstitialis TaxID=347529 RepID=A0AA38W7P1_9ASTR|nr:hypothetical protein OSB04_015632 [Centaurea solstitialis]